MKRFVFGLLLSTLFFSAFAQQSKPIAVQNLYFPKPGKEEAVYQWRLHASDVRAKLGLPKGRVLKKKEGEASYYVIWECDYPSLEARESDVQALDKSDEFKNVQAHMSTLIQKFERNIWEINVIPPTEDESQIRQNRLASNSAIAAHDTAGIAKHWSTKIFVLTSRNVQNIGKRQNMEAFFNEFKSKPSVVYIRTPDKVEVFPSGSMASETGTWVGRWKNDTEPIELSGTYYAKWIKTGDQWLICAEVYTPLTCLGDSYCKTFAK